MSDDDLMRLLEQSATQGLDAIREAQEKTTANLPKPLTPEQRAALEARRSVMLQRKRDASQRLPLDTISERTMYVLDSLECYVRALEDALFNHDRGAPLLRGTWRDKASDHFARRLHRLWSRDFRKAASDLRNYAKEKAKRNDG